MMGLEGPMLRRGVQRECANLALADVGNNQFEGLVDRTLDIPTG